MDAPDREPSSDDYSDSFEGSDEDGAPEACSPAPRREELDVAGEAGWTQDADVDAVGGLPASCAPSDAGGVPWDEFANEAVTLDDGGAGDDGTDASAEDEELIEEYMKRFLPGEPAVDDSCLDLLDDAFTQNVCGVSSDAFADTRSVSTNLTGGTSDEQVATAEPLSGPYDEIEDALDADDSGLSLSGSADTPGSASDAPAADATPPAPQSEAPPPRGARRGTFDAQERQRRYLDALALRKARQSAQARSALQRKQQRHRSLTEELCARARLRRGCAGAQDTAPAKAQSEARTQDEEEEQRRAADAADALRVERIRAARQRHKQKYKVYLERMKHEKAQREERDRLAGEQKAALRRKVREKTLRQLHRTSERRNSGSRRPEQGAADNGGAAGSAAALLRARRRSAGKEAAAPPPAPPMSEEEKRRRRRAARVAWRRAQEHLASLRELQERSKLQATSEQQRQARRAQLVKDRILREAQESKALRDEKRRAEGEAQRRAEQERQLQEERRPRVDAEGARRIFERLTERRTAAEAAAGDGAFRDFEDWKRRNGVAQGTSVFCMSGWYPCVKEELERRGWVYNADKASTFFDLKWTLYSTEVKGQALEPWQRCNHFTKNVAITTKAGLLRSLRDLPWRSSCPAEAFYPRSYDLSIEDDMRAFLEDYKACQAFIVLRDTCARALGGGDDAIDRLSDMLLDEDRGRAMAAIDDMVAAAGGGAGAAPARLEEAIRWYDAVAAGRAAQGRGEGSRGGGVDKDEDGGAGGPVEGVCGAQRADDAAEGMAADPAEDFGVSDGNEGPQSVTCSGDTVPAANEAAESDDEATIFDDSDLDDDDDDGGGDDDDDAGVGVSARPASAGTGTGTGTGADLTVNPEVVRACLTVLGRSVCTAQELLDSPSLLSQRRTASALEWEALGSGTPAAARPSQRVLPCVEARVFPGDAPPADAPRDPRERRRWRRRREAEAAQRCSFLDGMRDAGALSARGLRACLRALRLRAERHAQFRLDSVESGNLWIVKPAAKSRGRGIRTFADLDALLSYTESDGRQRAANHWVVQKYMENPLLVGNRKFDMRQWVLVTDWNPLTIWFCDEFYCRFAVEEYDASALADRYAHLVNNSVSKSSAHYHRAFEAEDGQAVEDHMWDAAAFRRYLEASGGDYGALVRGMEDAVVQSLASAQDSVEHRRGSWELYGYDFMVDEDMKPWLIEINSSPACDYSTAVTERYVRRGLVDLLKVVLDWDPCGTRGQDTGAWRLLHRASAVERGDFGRGTDLGVRGIAVRRE